MLCDSFDGHHWVMKGQGGKWNKAEAKHSRWCHHAGGYTSWGDFNGDGKADLFCDDFKGRHWVGLSKGDGTFHTLAIKGLWCTVTNLR